MVNLDPWNNWLGEFERGRVSDKLPLNLDIGVLSRNTSQGVVSGRVTVRIVRYKSFESHIKLDEAMQIAERRRILGKYGNYPLLAVFVDGDTSRCHVYDPFPQFKGVKIGGIEDTFEIDD